MVWHLLLAHFIADYPLQPAWMVRNKNRAGVLLLHVLTHLLVMLAVLLPISGQWWPYLLSITAFHFGIDLCKNWFTSRRPRWITGPYLIDQACHLLSIGLVSQWAQERIAQAHPYLSTKAAVIGIGFLLVTFVYMVTERIFNSDHLEYGNTKDPRIWGRLFLRAGLLAALLLVWNRYTAAGFAGAAVAFVIPYSATRDGLRTMLADLLVTLSTAALVIRFT